MRIDEVANDSIEFQLAQLIRLLVRTDAPRAPLPAGINSPVLANSVALAKVLLTMQEWRIDVVLDEQLLDEVSWTILLDLYAASRLGQRLSISSACIGSQAPATTALRHIHQLTQAGLIRRTADPHDARRIYLQIEPVTAQRLEAWLHSLHTLTLASSH